MPARSDKPLEIRIKERIRIQWNSALGDFCWIWTGGTDGKENPYGVFRYHEKTEKVHRIMWRLNGNELPKGHAEELHHICDNRLCCNPSHLELTSNAEHKTKHPRPIRTHCKKGHILTPEENTSYKYRCRICLREYDAAWHRRKRDMIDRAIEDARDKINA